MLTDQELIEQLRAELAPLRPPSDLIERLRGQAAADEHQAHRPRRSWIPLNGSAVGGAVAILVGLVVLVVIGGGALVLLGHRIRSAPPQTETAPVTNSSTQALVAELGILRQPQTAQARAFNTVQLTRRRRAQPVPPPERLIPRLTRVAPLPDGAKLTLYVARLTSAARYGGLGYQETYAGNGLGGCCMTANDLRHPRGPMPDQYDSGSHHSTWYFEIVPDGVARSRWVFPRQPIYPPPAPARPFAAALTIDVVVHDNIAAMKLPQRGSAQTDTWYAADGHIIATHTSRVLSGVPRLASPKVRGYKHAPGQAAAQAAAGAQSYMRRAATIEVDRALVKKFRLLRQARTASPLSQITVAAAISGLAALGSSYGANPTRAGETAVGSAKDAVWLVPGSTGACLVDVEGPQGAVGSGCNSTSAVDAGDLWTLDAIPYRAGGAKTQVLIGAAPDGNASVTVSWADGGTTVVPVTDNIYSVPTGSHTGWKSVTLKNSAGTVVAAAGMASLP